MKTKFTISILTVAFAFSFIACQKSIEGDPLTAAPEFPVFKVVLTHDTSNLVKTYIQKSNGDSIVVNYTYDQTGRVVTAKYLTGLNKVYNYSANSYTVNNIVNGAISSQEEHLLVNSIVDSVTYFGPNTDTTSEKYTYDAYKHVVVQKQYSKRQLVNTVTAEYDAANKNIIKVSAATNQQLSYTYTNYLLKINFGLIYEPPSRENLVETTTYSGRLNMVQLSQYNFDSLNRVSKETVTNKANNELLLTREYKY